MVEIESCVRGHHVYKAMWKPTLNEELNCYMYMYKEEDNPHDPYAVAVTKGDSKMVVGHGPRKISAACYLCLARKENSLAYKVTGERAFSKHLRQGGLQMPCVLAF